MKVLLGWRIFLGRLLLSFRECKSQMDGWWRSDKEYHDSRELMACRNLMCNLYEFSLVCQTRQYMNITTCYKLGSPALPCNSGKWSFSSGSRPEPKDSIIRVVTGILGRGATQAMRRFSFLPSDWTYNPGLSTTTLPSSSVTMASSNVTDMLLAKQCRFTRSKYVWHSWLKTGKVDERRWMKMTHWHGKSFLLLFVPEATKGVAKCYSQLSLLGFFPLLQYPIPSMYGIFPYISHQNQPFMSVNIQSSHGWCGYGHIPLFL